MSTGGPTSTTTASMPEYIQPYVSNLLQGAQQQFYSPYTAYSGPRIAEQSPTYMWGAENLVNNSPSPYLDMAGVGTAGTMDRVTQEMDAPGWLEQNGVAPAGSWAGPAAPTSAWGGGAWSGRSFTEPGIAGLYMNPYFEGPMNIQLREAGIDEAQAREAMRANAASRGAFGGSRSAILESEAARNADQRESDIVANATNTAYNTGREQFNTEENRGLQGWQANTGQFNADANRALQSWQANTGQFNADANRGLEAWKAGANQYNTEAGRIAQLAGAQQGLGSLLNTISQNDFNNNRTIIQDIMNVGLTEEGRRQRELDMDYADFEQQRDYPAQQLDRYRALIYGSPYTQGSAAQQEAPPNWLTQMAGLGSLLWGGTK